MKRILLLSMVFSFVCVFSAWAQRTVSGKVTDDKGEGLPGVNVVIKGTTTGVTTDLDGNFQITVPDDNTVLVLSSVGMATKEVSVGARTTIDVALEIDTKELSEVVVVGYGTQQRSKLTSSQTSIAGTDISTLAAPSFDTQLAGRSAGVQVIVGTGIIGTAPVINIRGVNSITSGTFPLIVVDGVPMITGNQSSATNTNPLGDINPNDIASYEILKDGAATAIYGSRAANGVILITTKRGSGTKGKLSVDLSITSGYTQEIDRFDLLNAEQFVEVANLKLANSGLAAGAFLDPDGVETDWQDVLFRKGKFTNYNLGVSGSAESTNYYFSVGYQQQEGAVVANEFDRLSFRSNVDHKVNKYLELGTGISISRTNTTGLNTGTNALSGNISAGLRLFPNVSPYSDTNATGYNLSPDNSVLGSGANTRNIDNNYTNAAFVLANNQFNATTNRVLGNIYAKVNIVTGLTFRTQFGLDFLGNDDFISYDPRHGDGRGSNGIVFNQYRQVTRWNTQNTINYGKDFGIHGIDITLGNEFQQTTVKSFFGQGANFSDVFFIQDNLISGQFVTPTSGGTYSQNGFISYFGRLNYALNEKYLIGFSVRRDGLSNLPEDTRQGLFYGGSVGYRLSDESFYQNLGITNVLNLVKLRASYAQVGNVEIGFFPYQSLYGAGRYGSQNGAGFSQAGNPNLEWETSKKLNYGADFGFLNNKINLIVDYFVNDIDGLILDSPTVPSAGIPNNSISSNVGVIRNSGLELTLNATPVNSNGLRWDVSANYTTLKNEVIALAQNTLGETLPLVGSFLITRVGDSQNSIYGFEYAGVNPANGNPMYVKGSGEIVQRNGNTGAYSYYNPDDPTNETVTVSNGVNAALSTADIADGGDRKILGNTLPKFYGGLTNTVNYKGFTLEVFLRFTGGNQVYNRTAQDNLYNQDFTNSGTGLLKSWTPENPNTDVPKMWLNRNDQVNQTGLATSRFVEDGDFLRVQNVILSYNVPSSVLAKLGDFNLASARVFVQGQNLANFTKYSGIDPELGAGIDNNTSPIFKTYTFGVNLGF